MHVLFILYMSMYDKFFFIKNKISIRHVPLFASSDNNGNNGWRICSFFIPFHLFEVHSDSSK